MQEEPKEILVDRVVEIWKGLLSDPEYDNGDDSIRGMFGKMLAEKLPNNATQEKINKFGEHLKEIIMTPRDNGWYDTRTSVDYGPDIQLSEAAEKAGLEMEFPWKTDVYIYSDHVSVRAGYSANPENHYPLPNGKWLITDLKGDDIEKVIDYVTGGNPEFKISD